MKDDLDQGEHPLPWHRAVAPGCEPALNRPLGLEGERLHQQSFAGMEVVLDGAD